MNNVEKSYGLMTEEDMGNILLYKMEPTNLTEVHGLGTGLKAAKAGSYAGAAAADW